MLYENYQKKIMRISAGLAKLLRLLPLIIAGVVLVAAGVTALLVARGNISGVEVRSEVTYGEELDFSARAFLSSAKFEYRAEGQSGWSEEVPRLPGRYFARAVSAASFGGVKYSDEFAFALLPRSIEIMASGETLAYGDRPSATASLAPGDSLSVVDFVYSQVTPESVTLSVDADTVVITDRNGTDVTDAYVIGTPEKSLAVIKREIAIDVGSDTKTYDGEPLRCEWYEITSGSLADGDTLDMTFGCEIVNAGKIDNIPEYRIRNGDGEDVTEFYSVALTPGTLRIRKLGIVLKGYPYKTVYNGEDVSYNRINTPEGLVVGHRVELTDWTVACDAGTYKNVLEYRIVDADGVNVTENYEVTTYFYDIVIEPRPLSVTTGSGTWEFDRQLHSKPDYEVSGLIDGHRAEMLSYAGIKDAGSVENRVSLAVYDQYGKDVTYNYKTVSNWGTLTVTRRPVTIRTESATWEYDGQYHSGYGITFVSGSFIYGGATEYNYTKIKNVGEVENRVQIILHGENIANYDITYIYGTLKVIPRRITIKTYDSTWVYDGENHSKQGYAFVSGGIPSTDRFLVDGYVEIVDVGTLQNEFKYRIMGAGVDVSENYILTFQYGTLEVTPRPITLKPADVSKAYDGKPLYGGRVEVVAVEGEGLMPGQVVSADTVGQRTEVGVSESSLNGVRITMGTRDVTSNYTVKTQNGLITVLPAGSGGTGGGGSGEGSGEGGSGGADGTGGTGGTGGGSVGGDFSMQDMPSDSIREVMAVIFSDSNGVIYLRTESFGDYTGSGWTVATPYGKTLPGGYSYNYLTALALSGSGAGIKLADIVKCKQYMLPYYIAPGTSYNVPTSDTVYSDTLDKYTVSYYSIANYIGNLDSLKGNLGEYSEYELEYRKFVYDTYLALDVETRAYMKRLIAEQGFDADDPAVITAVARYIQSAAVYSLDYDKSLDTAENVVIAFLEEYKEGKCVHYASAATLLYRALGIPARYVHGYMVETRAGEWVDVTTPGHAWVEVYIDGVGWVQVEVTGSVRPARQTIEITPEYACKTYDGRELVAPNRVEPDALLGQLLELGYTYEAVVSGRRTAVGRGPSEIIRFVLYDPSGADVTDDYDIVYRPGTLEILSKERKVVNIYLHQLRKYYDGKPLSFGHGDYTVGEVDDGVTLSLELYLSMTEVGHLTLSALNDNIDKYASYRFVKNGVDVTDSYAIVFAKYGEASTGYIPIQIDPRPIELTAASDVKVYDGKPLENSSVSVSMGSLVEGHLLRVETVGSITEVGTKRNEITSVSIVDSWGRDVTENYSIDLKYGMLTVLEPDE